MVTKILIIRHGETEWNAERRIQGHRDVPLNERGIRQAERAAAALAGEALAAVYSSDLLRATQTADALAAPRGLVVHPDAGLREAAFGAWEGLDEKQIRARYPEEYRLWRGNSLLHRPPGGEGIPEVQARAGAVYDRILSQHAGQSVAIVSHGGPIKALVLYAIGAPLDAYPTLRMRNASVSIVEIGRRGPVLALYDHVCGLA